GDVTRDDNGGAHHQFTVSPTGDLLLIYGGPDFERPDRYANALTTLGWSYDVWKGPLSDAPVVGDLSGGMRAYTAVWYQNGLENSPPFSDAARDAITSYLDGGGRLVVVGHDLAWAFGDPTSDFYTVARHDWLQNTLHTVFNLDPAGWTSIVG